MYVKLIFYFSVRDVKVVTDKIFQTSTNINMYLNQVDIREEIAQNCTSNWFIHNKEYLNIHIQGKAKNEERIKSNLKRMIPISYLHST